MFGRHRKPPKRALLRVGVIINFKEKSVQINLTWTLPTQRTNGIALAPTDITKVTVVRNGTMLAEVPPGNSYSDSSPVAGDNVYVVHVTTADGLVSAESNRITVTVPAAPAAAVTDLAGTFVA